MRNFTGAGFTPPRGLVDVLPDEAERVFDLAHRLIRTLRERRYRLVLTPLLDYIETFAASGEPHLDEKTMKIIEWESGKVMALRGDFTPQIARLASALLRTQKDLPQRFAYFGPVLKVDLRKAAKKREVAQVGAELIGKPGPAGDREIIELCTHLLLSTGLRDFVLQVGDVRFLKSLARGATDRSLTKKEWPNLNLAGLEADSPARIPELEGGPELIDRVRRRVRNAEAQRALRELAGTVRGIGAPKGRYSIHVDLAEVRDLHYYTGLFFQVFHRDLTTPVATGGRYDRLLRKFGRDLPATGFAVDLSALSRLVPSGSRVRRVAGSR